jgi:hypothetical protein
MRPLVLSISLVVVVFAVVLPGKALADTTLVDDPLDGSTTGAEMDGGEFLDEGGWRSTGGRIIYDAGRVITDGYFECTMRGFTTPAQGIDKYHPISGWEVEGDYSHHTQPGSFWNWRIGTGYNPFKVLAASQGGGTRVESRVGNNDAVNRRDLHTYRVEWRDGLVRFLFDGEELQQWTFDRFAMRHFTIGSDDQYDISDPAPILADVVIVDRGENGVDPELTGLDRTATQWSPFVEWSLDNPSYSGNPFDLVAEVTFTHPDSGQTRTTQMFYGGGDVWKFRFTATRVGTWNIRTSSSDADLDGLSGVVDVAPNPDPGVHGFVTHQGHNYVWQGSGRGFVPQLVMADDLPDFAGNPGKVDADIQTFLVEHGFNGFHVLVLCRWFDLDEAVCHRIDNPEPDVRTFDALELLITRVHAAGGMIHMWAWGDESRGMTPTRWGKNGTEDRRLQRYIAARLGPVPGWTMGYGFDNDEWVVEEDLRSWRTHMHDRFGWPHLLGARDADPNSGTDHSAAQIYEGLDYSGYEHHQPSYEVYVAAIDARPDKPSFSEDRFRIRDPSPYPEKDYDEERTRRGLWHSTMAGGVANIWGNLGDGSGSGSMPYLHPEWIKTNARFFEARFDVGLVRDNDITNGVCLRRGDATGYLFYLEEAASLQMDLSSMDGAKDAVAVDTLLPYAEIDLGTLAAENQTWTAPYASDWAVAVGSFAPVAPDPDPDADPDAGQGSDGAVDDGGDAGSDMEVEADAAGDADANGIDSGMSDENRADVDDGCSCRVTSPRSGGASVVLCLGLLGVVALLFRVRS